MQLEALKVGSIDFCNVGEALPIFSQAAGSPLVYVAATMLQTAFEKGTVDAWAISEPYLVATEKNVVADLPSVSARQTAPGVFP